MEDHLRGALAQAGFAEELQLISQAGITCTSPFLNSCLARALDHAEVSILSCFHPWIPGIACCGTNFLHIISACTKLDSIHPRGMLQNLMYQRLHHVDRQILDWMANAIHGCRFL